MLLSILSGKPIFCIYNFGHFTLFHLFLPMWSEMIQNAKFWSFCTFFSIFSYQSGINPFRTPSFGHSILFPICSYQSGIESFRATNFGHSIFLSIFSYQSVIKSFRTLNFGHSPLFPIFSHQSCPK